MHYIAVALVLLVASYLITSALAPKAEARKPAALGDFEFPQAAEGTPQAVVFGDCWTGDWQVLWYGEYEVVPIKAKGGKK